MDIGMSDTHRKQITDGLSHLLADSYVLYLMTHNFHWNVTGPMFRTLHLMFMSNIPNNGTHSTKSLNGFAHWVILRQRPIKPLSNWRRFRKWMAYRKQSR